jgi:hypothetical protein
MNRTPRERSGEARSRPVRAPGFLVATKPARGALPAGFALVVGAGRVAEGSLEDGARGAIAGRALPLPTPRCAPSSPRSARLMTGIPGPARSATRRAILARGRPSGLPFWTSALAALGFAASIGCIPPAPWASWAPCGRHRRRCTGSRRYALRGIWACGSPASPFFCHPERSEGSALAHPPFAEQILRRSLLGMTVPLGFFL